MESKQIFSLAVLGLCEHCGSLISMENMPGDAIEAEWKCPKCCGTLSGKSFGYNKKATKTRWVGLGGKWKRKKPEKDFDLGNWHIMIQTPRMSFL